MKKGINPQSSQVCSKFFKIFSGAAVLLSATPFFGCGQGSDGPSGASGNLDLIFTSSSLTSRSKQSGATGRTTTAGSNCSVTVNGAPVQGECYSPLNVAGFFSEATLTSTIGGAGVRLLGGGTLVGFANIMQKVPFDLASSLAMEGDDNIQDGNGGPYNMLSVQVRTIEYKFMATVASVDKYYTVRNFFTTSIPSTDPVISGCGMTSGAVEAADTYGTLYSAIAAQRRDIMVCIKSTEDAVCADSDFVWVDASGTTHATRPTSPLQLTGSYLLNATAACTAGADRDSVTWTGATLDLGLSTVVTVSAAFDGGVKTYTAGSSTGNQLTVTANVDTANSLFIPSSASAVVNLESVASETVLLQNLNQVTWKAVYQRNATTTEAVTDSSGINVTLSLVASDSET